VDAAKGRCLEGDNKENENGFAPQESQMWKSTMGWIINLIYNRGLAELQFRDLHRPAIAAHCWLITVGVVMTSMEAFLAGPRPLFLGVLYVASGLSLTCSLLSRPLVGGGINEVSLSESKLILLVFVSAHRRSKGI
jgi:hypothetical protein